jgi:putative ABC transport system permease protein
LNVISRLLAVNLRENLQHKVRGTVSIAVIAVSIALVVAVFGTYGSITGSVNELSQRIAGSADLEVSGITDAGFTQSLVQNVRSVNGVAAAAPILRMRVPSTAGYLLFLGVDESIQSLKSDLQKSIHDEISDTTLLANTVVVGPLLAKYVGANFAIDNRPVKVASALHGRLAHEINSGDFVVTSLALAQEITGRVGSIDSILLTVNPQADIGHVRSDLSKVVSGQALVMGPLFRTGQAQSATALMRNSTMVVALIASIVASFLIFNSMNMAVVERRSSVAMLRALGVRRSVLSRDLISEAIIFGLVGSALGVPLGILAGRLAVGSLPPTLVQSFDATIHFTLPFYATPIAIICGIAACVLATIAAARGVFNVSPQEALGRSKIPDPETASLTLRIVYLGSGLLLIGASAVGIERVKSQIVVVLAAVLVAGILALCLAGSLVIVKSCSVVLKRVGSAGELARETMDRSPGRAWATAMTVAVSIGVGLATSGVMTNLVSSISKNLAVEGEPAVYVTTQDPTVLPTGPVVDPAVVDRVRADQQVKRIVPGQFAYVNWNDIRIVLVGVSEGSRAVLFAGLTAGQKAELLEGKGVVLSTQLARRLNLRIGDSIQVPSPSGNHLSRVIAVIDYMTLDPGAIALPLREMESWFHRRGATYLEVDVNDGASPAGVKERLRHVLPGDIVIYTGKEHAAAMKVATSQAGALAVALQWVVALVAAVALFNIFTLSVLKRKRELGVLRAMGANGKYVARLILSEAIAVGVVGAALGLVIGFSMHFFLDIVLSTSIALKLGFSVSPAFLFYVVGAMGLCLLGAIPPAIVAARRAIIESISEE